MAMAQTKFVSYEQKTSIIRVTGYENAVPRGVIVNPYFEKEVAFVGAIALLRILDELQDEISFPQKAMKPRRFDNKTRREPISFEQLIGDLAPPSGDEAILASFKLSILFRHNASWQGSVVWLEKGLQSEFRSALELVFLMDSVLSGTE